MSALPVDRKAPPETCVIEIVERHDSDSLTALGVFKPNEIRINGSRVMVERDSIVVHGMNIPSDEPIRVTLTLFARRVVLGEERVDEELSQ